MLRFGACPLFFTISPWHLLGSLLSADRSMYWTQSCRTTWSSCAWRNERAADVAMSLMQYMQAYSVPLNIGAQNLIRLTKFDGSITAIQDSSHVLLRPRTNGRCMLSICTNEWKVSNRQLYSCGIARQITLAVFTLYASSRQSNVSSLINNVVSCIGSPWDMYSITTDNILAPGARLVKNQSWLTCCWEALSCSLNYWVRQNCGWE